MDFVKRNILLLASGLVGIASLGLMIWGITRMGEVTTAMGAASSVVNSLNGAKAISTADIDNEYARIDQTIEYYDKMIEHFADATAKKPILEGLLPDPPGNEQGKQLKYDFRPAYKAAMDGLIERLHAGQPPTRAEVERIEDHLKKRQMELELTAEFDERTDSTEAPADTPDAPPADEADEVPDLPERAGPESCKQYWAVLAERAQHSADMLASISKARGLYCYADVFAFTTHAFYKGGTNEPSMDAIWDAQLWYWIQQDLVEILASVNDRAAEKVKGAGGKPWVANMPIKDIRGMGVSPYIDGGDDEARRSADDFLPPLHPDDAFTFQVAHPLYDVLNVRLQLVIDLRDLVAIIDALTHEKYNIVFNVSYERVEQSLDFNGKVYGPEPLALVKLDMQTYLCYRSFVPFMPSIIRERRGVEKLFEELVGNEEDDSGEDEDEG